MTSLTFDDLLSADLGEWRPLAKALHAAYRPANFTEGLGFVTAVAAAAEQADHHPEVTLGYRRVGLQLVSHDVGAITDRDVTLARTISGIARERGIKPDPRLSLVEIGLDTTDFAVVGPFWAALLTGDVTALGSGEVLDGTGQLPALWFQPTDAHHEPRQRFHLDVWVPHDSAKARVQAALAAGGRLVDDSQAPSYVVVADPDGNRACVCTAGTPQHETG
jgi:4a-hydroxytetrahydrobiopterin dehydratase